MSIRYNVAALLKEPVGATREYVVEARVLIGEDAPESRQIAGRVTFLRTDHGVLVNADLRGEQLERCDRCLRELDIALELEIEEEFIDSSHAAPGGESQEAFRIDARHTLDLEEAVRQSWTASLPMQSLCRPDCKGLCHRCGRDLSQSACVCPEEQDERWSALRPLAKQLERS